LNGDDRIDSKAEIAGYPATSATGTGICGSIMTPVVDWERCRYGFQSTSLYGGKKPPSRTPRPVPLTQESGLSESKKRRKSLPNYPNQLFYCYFTSQSLIAKESLVGGQ
jgi:hypothetical protein